MTPAPADEHPAEAAASAVRIEVVRGGPPGDAEVAALVIALTSVAAAGGADRGASVPAWARAALLENVGGRRPARPSDLDVAVVTG